jgi:hypothetical protein
MGGPDRGSSGGDGPKPKEVVFVKKVLTICKLCKRRCCAPSLRCDCRDGGCRFCLRCLEKINRSKCLKNKCPYCRKPISAEDFESIGQYPSDSEGSGNDSGDEYVE